ncbi:MAG: ferrochelatase [Pseudomonadota bacterium]|nr:ferrochelatase [Pseudomonadota bacterium]MDP1905861.1 ferrochelatase [Pseudomonadota bacterium]MDP2351733.1 ferrochelatase [Pseudomonadota bacterium]
MPYYLPEPPFKHDQPARVGILLINLGTPEAPTAAAVRPYLKEFLWDRRVVEIPRLLWWPILNGVILNTRPAKSAEKYASIWRAEGSPLKVYTERMAKLLKGLLGERLRQPLRVDYAMRYGKPGIAEKIAQLKAEGVDRLLLLPLYPQYAASSTGSALDAAWQTLLRSRNPPEVRAIKHFHDHPGYIAALRQSVEAYWAEHGRPDKLVISFHGTPRRSLDLGDPYHCECRKTGRLLAEALELAPEQFLITFQSRFGRAEWLKPYTAAALEELGRQKTRRVDVLCPGFTADCLETLEEIAMEGKTTFLSAGGGDFRYIPALNDRPLWINALADLAQSHLSGWIDETWSEAAEIQEAQRQLQQARGLGAKK